MLHLYLTGKPDIHLTLMNKRWKRKFKSQIKAGAVIFYFVYMLSLMKMMKTKLKCFSDER